MTAPHAGGGQQTATICVRTLFATMQPLFMPSCSVQLACTGAPACQPPCCCEHVLYKHMIPVHPSSSAAHRDGERSGLRPLIQGPHEWARLVGAAGQLRARVVHGAQAQQAEGG